MKIDIHFQEKWKIEKNSIYGFPISMSHFVHVHVQYV